MSRVHCHTSTAVVRRRLTGPTVQPGYPEVLSCQVHFSTKCAEPTWEHHVVQKTSSRGFQQPGITYIPTASRSIDATSNQLCPTSLEASDDTFLETIILGLLEDFKPGQGVITSVFDEAVRIERVDSTLHGLLVAADTAI